MKKILSIVNGEPHDGPTLEGELAQKGLEVETIHLDSVSIAADGRISIDGTPFSAEQYRDHIVIRSVMGGKQGDTPKSLELQRQLEAAGATAQTPVSIIEAMVDKNRCNETLTAAGILTPPSVPVKPGETPTPADIGFKGPYLVQKALGTGPQAIQTTEKIEEAIAMADAYANPTDGTKSTGAIIQPTPSPLPRGIALVLGIPAMADKPCHLRATLVGDELFGAHIVSPTEQGKYGFNALQGAQITPVDTDKFEAFVETLRIARTAAATLGAERIAAVDITFNASGGTRVLGVTPSPNLNVMNAEGLPLRSVVADDIYEQATQQQGQTQAAVKATRPSHHRGGRAR